MAQQWAVFECVNHGGHCLDRTGHAMTPGMAPTEYEERCRHCPQVRWATAQDPWSYRYEPPGVADD